jgi:O-antigen/teichoic acid export membrane protein
VTDLYRSVSFGARQTLFLFSVDLVTNLVDYGFHAYLGRALLPGDFAVVQTVNSAVLIVATTLAMMQPVVARYVAEAEARSDAQATTTRSHAVFRLFFRRSGWLGLALMMIGWLARRPVGAWLNVPALAVGLSSAMILLTLLRAVVGGMLQGQQRFVPFGLTRSGYAVGRFLFGLGLVGLGGGAIGAVAALPLGALVALLSGLAFLGWGAWRSPEAPPRRLWRDGLQLSAGSFLASAAYMSLLSSDLIWVNRSFGPDTAGAYAAAVLLRRALVLFPGAAVVVMYPRVVGRVTQGHLPDRLLLKVIGFVLLAVLLPTLFYFGFGSAILTFTFGPGYEEAASVLGLMGLAMCGYGIGSVWYNLFLATRPGPYVGLLVVTAVSQFALLFRFHTTLRQVMAIFGLAGWTLALGGAALYLFWLRRRLTARSDG